MKTYANKCVVCGRGAPGIHTGPVPPLSVIVARGPAKLKDMDFSAAVCSFTCADEYRRKHPLVIDCLIPGGN